MGNEALVERDDLVQRLEGLAAWYESVHPGALKTPSLLWEAAATLKAAEAELDHFHKALQGASERLLRADTYDFEGQIVVLKHRAEKAEADLAAAKANSELFERENEEYRQQVIDLQNQMMKERADLAAARAERDDCLSLMAASNRLMDQVWAVLDRSKGENLLARVDELVAARAENDRLREGLPEGVVATQWFCHDYADGWITFKTAAEALKYQRETGCAMNIAYCVDQTGKAT